MKAEDLFNTITYEPHVGQIRFHDSDARFKVLIAGARFGKSLAAARDVMGDLLTRGTRGWLVGPTYALARPEYEYIRDDLRRMGMPFSESARGIAGAARLVTPGQSEVRCLSAHSPHSLLGREIDWLILCEAAHIKREAFERFLRARLATRSGRLIVPTTPRGHNWIHELYSRGLGQENWESFRYATWDNPNISAEEIESAKQSLPPETWDEQFGGAFTSPAGRVYREFEPLVHACEKLSPPEGAVIYKGIDFGYTDPTVCLWATIDGDGRLLILREHRRKNLNMLVHARIIRAVDDEFAAMGCAIGPAFADPAGAMERDTLAREGVRTVAAKNDLAGGIALVRQRLALRDDGTPGLRIDRRCRDLVREFEGYQWSESSLPGERVPRKGNDHALDALRYLCVALSRKPGPAGDGLSW